MRAGIVAIPLFAAMWLAAPTLGAQEKDSRKDSPRIAVPRPEQSAQRENPPPADRASRAESGSKAGEQRARGGGEARDRGGRQGRDGGGRVTPRGYTQPEPRVVTRRDPVYRDPGYRGVNRGPVVINNYNSYRRPTYYAPVYYDKWARNYYRWSPLRYAPWGLIYGSVGVSNFGFYGTFGTPTYSTYGNYGYPYGGSYPPYYSSSYDLGGVRLQIRPRDAQVFVDGYYAGLVDDFDGTFQSLKLEPGGHKIEIRMPGFEDFELDVHVQPGRTINIREDLRPRP
jgi:hypothetical protein